MVKKAALFTLLLSASLSVFADNSDVATAITKSIKSQADTNRGQSSTIIYGGKDLSHPVVASAVEPTAGAKQPVLVG